MWFIAIRSAGSHHLATLTRMENSSKGDLTGGERTSKKPVATILLVLVLSLATWYFFYLESMPLTAAETTFVVGGWAVLVLIAKGFWGRFHKKSKAE